MISAVKPKDVQRVASNHRETYRRFASRAVVIFCATAVFWSTPLVPQGTDSAPPSDAQAEQPFSNLDVIALSNAGLSDELISTKIRQAPAEELDASTEAILQLNESGVSQAVIQAVLDRVAARRDALAAPLVRDTPPEEPASVTQDAEHRERPDAGEREGGSRWKFWQRGKRAGTASGESGSARRSTGSRGGDTFLNSDDYRDGEEIVDVFLTAPHYARMTEEFEYRGVEFDWAWVKGAYGGRKGKQFLGPDFDIRGYSTIRVSAQNFSPGLVPDLEDQVRPYFVEAMRRLGLTVVENNRDADLELGIAIVDFKSDQTYIFVAMLDPFIELELRLRDLRTGEDLMLVRNQDHNKTPVQGAGDTAASMMLVLQ